MTVPISIEIARHSSLNGPALGVKNPPVLLAIEIIDSFSDLNPFSSKVLQILDLRLFGDGFLIGNLQQHAD